MVAEETGARFTTTVLHGSRPSLIVVTRKERSLANSNVWASEREREKGGKGRMENEKERRKWTMTNNTSFSCATRVKQLARSLTFTRW